VRGALLVYLTEILVQVNKNLYELSQLTSGPMTISGTFNIIFVHYFKYETPQQSLE